MLHTPHPAGWVIKIDAWEYDDSRFISCWNFSDPLLPETLEAVDKHKSFELKFSLSVDAISDEAVVGTIRPVHRCVHEITTWSAAGYLDMNVVIINALSSHCSKGCYPSAWILQVTRQNFTEALYNQQF